ncbi:putative immunoglobulin-blocking virulence protein [Mycoplasma sp. E35C]|uniref:putative immunoglobulin-blocking virulence protein n=1 Tax=Mycoplasma sp. E35C TaxID=2801918 RepID=UPI001CA3EF95|nr:putative immunoglobulin-blocking virulence protein [Mycoplasma sp. E35C]QZX49133.1 putative immunoglobulin-blocking virulence protein [Mycoplasma sp. E35C]
MLSSKKRKIIKLVALSTTSVIAGATATVGILYANNIGSSDETLVQRSDTQRLENGVKAEDRYNSNNDVNTDKLDKQQEDLPVNVTPEQPKPETPKPIEPLVIDEPNNLAKTTAIKYVTYEHEDYNLDKEVPKMPNNLDKPVLSEAEATALYNRSKKRIEGIESNIKAGKSDANREALRKLLNYKGTAEIFNVWYEDLFKERNLYGRTAHAYEDLLTSIQVANRMLKSEAYTGRILKLDAPDNTTVTFGYEDDSKNPIMNYYKKVNSHRVLGTSNRTNYDSPDDILKGDFQGWTKTDTSAKYFGSKYGINASDGITVRSYTPTDKNDPYYKGKSDLNVFVLDVDTTTGYEKFIDFIKKVAAEDENKEMGVVLKNIGKKHQDRDVYDIIKSLPKNVKTLTVFIENGNTTSLLALEDRNLRELNIYTTGNAISEGWSINPLAFKRTNFIPSLATGYNVSSSYAAGTKVASTPIFTALKFDRNDDYKRVQEGLDVAFARRDERIFQGTHQGEGAKPVKWDFADAPIIRSLQNLDVKNAELREVILSKDLISSIDGNSAVVYDLSEFNHSQWTAAMQYQPSYQKRYIYFGRDREHDAAPQILILKGAENTLEAGSLQDLLTFVKYTTNGAAFRTIYVSSEFIAKKIREAAASERNTVNVTVLPEDKLNKYESNIFKKDPNLNSIGKAIKKS